jgi:hypothetical protein
MTPAKFPETNTTFAKDQPQYRQLPAHRGGVQGCVTTCWALTWRERLRVLWTGRLWLQQLTFGNRLQPQLPSVRKPLL